MALEWIATFVPTVAGLIVDDELECVYKEMVVACYIYVQSYFLFGETGNVMINLFVTASLLAEIHCIFP
jgi:hypothetical protein